jgi:hypothetical protein
MARREIGELEIRAKILESFASPAASRSSTNPCHSLLLPFSLVEKGRFREWTLLLDG